MFICLVMLFNVYKFDYSCYCGFSASVFFCFSVTFLNMQSKWISCLLYIQVSYSTHKHMATIGILYIKEKKNKKAK